MWRLTKSKCRMLASICTDIAQVFFGIFVAAIVVLSIDIDKLFVVILELGFAGGFWFLSIIFAEKGKL
ncbi:MAG: hypothetical protein HYV39_03200 [Candidatus Levybacteria bacterium]|nr:hypothetical protein [Candidatus Levybacteria bacterium]